MSPNALAAGNGPSPTGIVWMTVFVAGSILETVFEPLFETHTALFVTATERGFCPTRTLVTRFVRASIRNTRRPKSEPTQTAPPPYRRLAGPEFGMWIRRPTLFVCGLIRST